MATSTPKTNEARNLSPALDARCRALRHKRERVEANVRALTEETRTLARDLRAEGLTVRRIADLLGVSFQRVQQLVSNQE